MLVTGAAAIVANRTAATAYFMVTPSFRAMRMPIEKRSSCKEIVGAGRLPSEFSRGTCETPHQRQPCKPSFRRIAIMGHQLVNAD